MKRLGHSRRDFLRLAGATAIGTSVLPRPLLAAVGLEAPTAAVGIARSPSVAQALRDAVELAGGLDFIRPGQSVLLKPNQVAPTWHPMTTNPEVLYELTKLVAEGGARQVFIADQCVGTFTDTDMVMRVSRHWEAGKDAEADLGGEVEVIPVGFDRATRYLPNGASAWRVVRPPRASQFIEEGRHVGFQMAELLFHVDHVINVPCCKTHEQTWFTLTLKNFVGMVSPASRSFFHGRTNRGLPWREGDPVSRIEALIIPVSEAIAELNLAVTPSLNIIDATRPLYSGSQKHGDSVKIDTIIASRDRIAADVVGVALMRTLGDEPRIHAMSPWQHPMIRHAQKLDLGVLDREAVRIEHRGVQNIEAILAQTA